MAYLPSNAFEGESDIRRRFICHRLIDQYASSGAAIDAVLEALSTALSPYILALGRTSAGEPLDQNSARVLNSIIAAGLQPGSSYRWTPEDDLP